MSTTAPDARQGPGTAEALRTRIARRLADVPGCGRRLHRDEDWLYLHDPAMPVLAHGWKLHLSARPEELPDLVDLVVPVLLRHTCDAKFAAGAAVLRELNAGRRGAAAVGKAVTVYPPPQGLVELALELADVLAGRRGPRVVSDRRVRPDAPVHYRYGPFRVDPDEGASAAVGVPLMTGPDGALFPATAEARYLQPPWATDPFATEPFATDRPAGPAPAGSSAAAPARPAASLRLAGGRYRVTAGIVRSPNGHVYRAVDTADGRPVVVKQARAYVAEDAAGTDARGRLRHERRVLAALAGVPGVPQPLDHFRHGDEEYLVTTDRGPRDLRRDVLALGPYPAADTAPAVTPPRAPAGGAGPAAGREWWSLARDLLAVLDAVHARAVVVCDLKPANVVLDAAGRCSLVDFGVSALHGERPAGLTPGYRPPGHGAPRPADDLYALGMTLHFALTGLDPVALDPDPEVDRDRTLACLTGVLPEPGHPAVALLAGLLATDPADRHRAADTLRGPAAGPPRRGSAGPPATHRPVPRPPTVDARLLDAVIAHTTAECVRMARELTGPGAGGTGGRGRPALYDGAAGLGLELLEHADRPQVRSAVAALARTIADHPALTALGPGLYDGRAGVRLFLARAAQLLATGPYALPAPTAPPPSGARRADQVSGAAGRGTARLLLARQATAAGRPEEARRHLARATDHALDLAADPDTGPPEERNPGTAALAEGFAHGRAGVAALLLAVPDLRAQAAARRLVDRLAADLPRLLADADRPGATPRYASWCRGLAGIGTTLLRAGRRWDDPDLVDLADRAARSCLAVAPRLGVVVQCCGLAGIGELCLDLAAVTGDRRHRADAERVAALVLTRSAGPPDRPVFPGNRLLAESAAWATGTPGVLTFLRRLRHPAGPGLLDPG